MTRKKVVVIGGGHGQSAILRGIKKIEEIDITAIVTVADDGGSTGRLRRHFHIPAMGDIRNVLISLGESETLLATLMDYRFESSGDTDEDVMGHNLGNLILTAMTKSCGSFMDSITTLCKVLNVRGDIIPATSQVITLFARMQDGTIVRGESNIPNISNRIREVFYEEKVSATPAAIEAILSADIVVLGIGSVYTSILPNLIIPEIKEALEKSKAKVVYYCNAMTQPGETDGYSMEDHVQAFRHHGSDVDMVVMADDEIPDEILKRYHDEGSIEVKMREDGHDYEIMKCSLLDFSRDLVRHDSDKIRESLKLILERMN
ncbi:MAG: uridine diphosphate-N-acetylglucosamine-binding protein YvcK [Erysipelotrichaceae bacterium]|nr:uridine diphosphate-N-acetylglucosamine-binding protein YvcK [Erysipelotrichaceae bacterium]